MARLSSSNQVFLEHNELYRILRRHMWVLIGIVLLCLLIGVVANQFIPLTYESETVIRLKQAKNITDSGTENINEKNSANPLTTYVEILKSRSVIEPLLSPVKGHNLVNYYRFLSHLSVKMVKDTEIIKLRIRAKSPETAVKNAYLLINSFKKRLSYLSRTEQAEYREFLKNRLQKSRIELQNAERSLENYKKEAKILAPAEETKAIIERISAINQLNAENQVSLAAAHTRLNNANTQLSLARANIVPKKLTLEFQKKRLSQLKVKLVELMRKNPANHPDVLKLKAEIRNANENLNKEISNIINKEFSRDPVKQNLLQNKILTEVEITATEAQQELIQRILEENEQELVKLPVKEQELARLMRNNTLAQEIYFMLAKRFEEAKIDEVMQPDEVQIIDEPLASDQPVAPKLWLSLAIALILGCLLGIGAIIYLENSGRMIIDADDVRQYLDLPVLGVIPEFHLNKKQKRYCRKNK